VRTRVGYAGGSTPDPTYEDIGDHSEAVEVEFDPAKIAYRDLLAVFWNAHDSSSRSFTRQYRAAILWNGEEQRRLAEASLADVAGRSVRGIETSVEPLRRFTPAEDYHQKYYLRSRRVISAALHRAYPDEREFAASTAAARINGYLGGHGGPAQLAGEIGLLGLSGDARAALEAEVRERHPSESCPVPAAR
jgi:peptide-methionine (S)-S-oxide reductase